MRPIGENTIQQNYALVAIHRRSRFISTMWCNGPTTDHVVKLQMELSKIFGLPGKLSEQIRALQIHQKHLNTGSKSIVLYKHSVQWGIIDEQGQ